MKVRTRNCQGGLPGEGFCFTSIIGATETRDCDSGENEMLRNRKSKTISDQPFLKWYTLLFFTQKLVHFSHLIIKMY